MRKKSVLIISLLIILMFVAAGCKVSNYLLGNATGEKKAPEEQTDEQSILNEIEQLTKESNTTVKEEGQGAKEVIKEIEEIPTNETENITETNISKNITQEVKKENITEEANVTESEEEGATDLVSDKPKYEAEVDYSKDVVKLSVKENEEVRLKPTAEDADLDTLKFTFTKPFDKDGYWKTNYGDAGEYEVTITVSDGVLTTSRKVLLTVERVNVPPVITVVSELEALEGDLIKIKPNVTDPNKDKVTVTISDPVDNDGEWQTSYTDHGVYDVIIEATDGELKSEKDVKLTVKRKNIPPEITGVPDSLTVNEGDKVELKVEVTDLNEDKITLKISDPIGDDGVWETSYTDNGEYKIDITASDGEATTTKVLNLKVNDINKAPVITDIKLG